MRWSTLIKSILVNLAFFWSTVAVYRLIHSNLHFGSTSIQYGIIASVLIVLFSLFSEISFPIIAGILICWCVSSGAYPEIINYLFWILVGFIAVALYLREWDAGIVVIVMVINLTISGSIFINEIKSSPKVIALNTESYTTITSKVKSRRINCDKEEFIDGLNSISIKHNINPSHLLFVMWMESRISTTAVNPYSDARGLIQWMPKTSRSLGINHSTITDQDGMIQLRYVDKYMNMFDRKISMCNDVYSLYLLIFYPAAIGKGDDYTFPDNVVQANPAIFKGGNSYKDFTSYVDKQMFYAGIGI